MNQTKTTQPPQVGGHELTGLLCQKVTIELNNETRFILGRPNFWCGQLSRNLRELGHDIPKKAEEEQAYVIYWMLGLYEQYRDTWIHGERNLSHILKGRNTMLRSAVPRHLS
jgi:hypothetical protein